MKKYKPNLTDKRVLERIEQALFGVILNLSDKKSKPWSHNAIKHFFGEKELGSWLRDNLLICTDPVYVADTGKTMEWAYNKSVYKYLRKVLRGDKVASLETYLKQNPVAVNLYDTKKDIIFDNKLINELAERSYGMELKALEFEYKDKSDRLWHPLQNIKKIHKKTVFARQGLLYNYDIEACAPTVLFQLAKQRGLDVYTPAIELMLSDKNKVRRYLADAIGIDIKTVKFILNALLCGAKLMKYNEYSPYKHAITAALNNDNDLIEKVKSNPFIQLLKNDYKELWGAISTLEVRELRSNGTIKPLNSKHKWRIYFSLERKILNAVQKLSNEIGVKIFSEHDGFVSNKPVNITALSDFVEKETGLRVSFVGEVLSPVLEASVIAEELKEGFVVDDNEYSDHEDDFEIDDEEIDEHPESFYWIVEYIKTL